MKRVKVEVTKEHIKEGSPGVASCCPIARAVRVLGLESPRVYPDGIYFGDYYCRQLVRLPRSASRFVNAFDAGKKVKPFNFFLEVE